MIRPWMLLLTGPAVILLVAVTNDPDGPWAVSTALAALVWWAVRLNRKET